MGNHFDEIAGCADESAADKAARVMHPKVLTQADLDQAITDKRYKGDDAVMLASVYVLYGPLSNKLHPDAAGLTRADVDASLSPLTEPKDSPLSRFAAQSLTSLHNRLAGVNQNLWGETNDPKVAVTGDAVGQGFNGDCWAMAPISTVANAWPETIPSMIKQEGDKFVVTFPKEGAAPVTVERPTDTELALFAAGSKSGIWVPVIEKALAKYFSDKYFERFYDVQPGGLSSFLDSWMQDKSNSRSVINGGNPARALELLTGHKVISIDTSAVGAGDTIMSAKDWGLLMDAASRSEFSDKVRDGNSVVYRHDYSVRDLNSDGVVVRNPWGRHRPGETKEEYGAEHADGTLPLTWNQFLQSFEVVNIVVK